MNDVFAFDYNYNKDLLLGLWEDHYKQKAETYTDERIEKYQKTEEYIRRYGKWERDTWKIARAEENYYTEFLCDLFNINAKPRFYVLKANSILPFHVDHGTQCAINFILGEDPAPVRYEESNKEYFYKSGLLNTTKSHGVWNGPEDRIIFKLSIMDESFESVKNKIQKTLAK